MLVFFFTIVIYDTILESVENNLNNINELPLLNLNYCQKIV